MRLINMQNANLFSVFNVHLMQLSFPIVLSTQRLSQFITRLTSGVSSENDVQCSGQNSVCFVSFSPLRLLFIKLKNYAW